MLNVLYRNCSWTEHKWPFSSENSAKVWNNRIWRPIFNDSHWERRGFINIIRTNAIRLPLLITIIAGAAMLAYGLQDHTCKRTPVTVPVTTTILLYSPESLPYDHHWRLRYDVTLPQNNIICVQILRFGI